MPFLPFLPFTVGEFIALLVAWGFGTYAACLIVGINEDDDGEDDTVSH